jgi:hypothetical protein
MFNIPDRYLYEVEFPLKDFIPKDLNPNDRKKLKGIIKNVRLTYQIIGEEIPSVSDGIYRCEAIQLYDLELDNIKGASFVASIYQNLIKSFCILHFYDTNEETYSLAIKRLNQNDNTQIVVEESLITQPFMRHLPDTAKEHFMELTDYNQTKNKQDKVCMYKEWFYKAYMLQNENAYTNTQLIINGNNWYDSDKTERIFTYFRNIVETRKKLKKAVSNAERVRINKEIKKDIQVLDTEVV